MTGVNNHEMYFLKESTKNESLLKMYYGCSHKCLLSESGEEYAEIEHHLQVKTVQNNCKEI